jgi:hypothetical protein
VGKCPCPESSFLSFNCSLALTAMQAFSVRASQCVVQQPANHKAAKMRPGAGHGCGCEDRHSQNRDAGQPFGYGSSLHDAGPP